MSSQLAHILILNVPRFRRTSRLRPSLLDEHVAAKPLADQPRPRTYALLVPLLKILGYRFTTLGKALEASAGKYACLTFDGAERELLLSVVPTLEAKKIPATLFVDTKTIAPKASNKAPRLAQLPLSWKSLYQLTRKGWEIGSLGHETVNLTEKSYSAQQEHIRKSRDLLTKNLGEAPKVFAYPFGAYDATTLSCVRDSGFLAAVTLRPLHKNIVKDAADIVSRYQLPRITLSGRVLRDLFTVLRHAWHVKRQPARRATPENLQGLKTFNQSSTPLSIKR